MLGTFERSRAFISCTNLMGFFSREEEWTQYHSHSILQLELNSCRILLILVNLYVHVFLLILQASRYVIHFWNNPWNGPGSIIDYGDKQGHTQDHPLWSSYWFSKWLLAAPVHVSSEWTAAPPWHWSSPWLWRICRKRESNNERLRDSILYRPLSTLSLATSSCPNRNFMSYTVSYTYIQYICTRHLSIQ